MAAEFKENEFTWTKIEREGGKIGVRIEDVYGSVEIVDISNPTTVSNFSGDTELVLKKLDKVVTTPAELEKIKKELGIEVNSQVEVSGSK